MIGLVPWPSGHIVPTRKLTGDLLDPNHSQGAAKCRFLTAFGFHPQDPAALERALLAHASPANFLDIQVSPYGLRFRQHGPMPTPVEADPVVRSIWQIDPSTGLARFVTLKPAR